MNNKEMSAAARHANVMRARREVAGPLLRAALEPVLRQIREKYVALILTDEEEQAIVAACDRADHGVRL
ncbi:MAG TPA: hypothetical protein VEA69_21030 [Tepidisphaeraceae bacterium]|nr:hypothetical protein [Tepidisphaeraceae bacterium]